MRTPSTDSENNLTRREVLQRLSTAACCVAINSPSTEAAGGTTQIKSEGFFTLIQQDGRWWLVTPERAPFFSIGLNHIDPSPLRTSRGDDLWDRKYGNSMQRWLQESVAPDMKAWGFNSVGWTQEVVTRGPTNHRHSRAFTFEEYQWLSLPYCHQLPFADFHQWETETRFPDFESDEFAVWCDYVARENCSRMKDDPKLIGYFYIDCPTWIHSTQFNKWRGPLFDPDKLQSQAGRDELKALASRYYKTTHDAIRRYDPHHLILGDRYEAGKPIADEVIQAALPYVDVLSFQDFGKPAIVADHLTHWHKKSNKPVLLADHADTTKLAGGAQRHEGAGYVKTLNLLRSMPSCVGFHLCGAYLRNETRKRGLRDAAEAPDSEAIAKITRANQLAAAWLQAQRKIQP